MVRAAASEWGLVDVVRADGTMADPGTVGRADGGANVGDKCRCRYCGLVFNPQARLIRTHLSGIPGDVQRCPGPTQKDGEVDAVFAERTAAFQAAKAACIAAVDKQRADTAAAKEKAALDKLTGGASSSQPFRAARTWLADGHKKPQEAADLALALGLACAGIPPNAAEVPELRQALRAVAAVGPSYVQPGRLALGGHLLRKVHEQVRNEVAAASTIQALGGVTVTSDGVTNSQRKPIINILEVSGDAVTFVTAKDCSGHVKDGDFIAGMIIGHINSKPDPRSVVAVCMDNATRAAWPIIEKACPWVVCIPCTAHVLDLLLEDICKLPMFRPILANANALRMFLQNKSFAHYVYITHAEHELQNPGATRFRQVFIMLASLLREKDAIYNTMVDRRLKDYVSKNKNQRSRSARRDDDDDDRSTLQEKYATLKALVEDDHQWALFQLLLDIMKPIAKFQALVDSNTATASKAYFNFYMCQQEIEKMDFSILEDDAEDLRSQIIYLITNRWNYFETPLTLAGYALDLEFWDCDAAGDETVMNGLFTMIERTFMPPTLGSNSTVHEELEYDARVEEAREKSVAAQTQFAYFKNRTIGVFNRPEVIAQAAKMSAYDWWFVYGGACPELRIVALRVLAQPCSSSSSERAHKDLSVVVTKKRTRMGWDKAEANMYIRINRRMLNTTRSLDYRVQVIPDSGGYDDDSGEDDVGADAGAADPAAADAASAEVVELTRKSNRIRQAEARIAQLMAAPAAAISHDDDSMDEGAGHVDAWAEAKAASTDELDVDVTTRAVAAKRSRDPALRAAATKRRARAPEALQVQDGSGRNVGRQVRRPARLEDCVC